MGTSSSSLKELQHNKYLLQFSGKDPISPNDPFWNQLLSFTFIPPHNCADSRLLEESTHPMLDALLANNPQTGNVAALAHVFLTHSTELKESILCQNKVFVWQTYNSLFIIRSVLKYFIESLGESSMLKQLFSGPSDKDSTNNSESEKLLELLVNALIEIIVDVSLENITYAIIVEAVNTLLVLLSVQMFSTQPASSSLVYQTVMLGKCSIHSLLLVKTLLVHYVNQDVCPHCVDASVEGAGIISGITSGLWNILTLSYVRGAGTKDFEHKAVLANQSLLLLLALANHCTNDNDMKNPYREALCSFNNALEFPVESGAEAMPAFKMCFSPLYSTLCSTLKDDQTTLLVYLLLHKNSSFKQYVISLSDVDALVVPILKILYNASEKSSHHIYMALIVLLILSENEHFDKHIHHVKLSNVTWYLERHLSEITLGGLVILILTRTIQYNMTRMHDKYLHTNCLAALANMSAHFQNLHPYVCQKFIGLLSNMIKKQSRLYTQKPADQESTPSGSTIDASPELMQDISVLDEVIRMLLEILNSCLSSQLKSNGNLLYAMLYNRALFSSVRSCSPFEDIMQNIGKVMDFFSERLQAIDPNPSVVEVYKVISDASAEWSKESLKKFPELKFKYVEEGKPEDFFIPYLWSLVFQASDIYWNPKNILIFNPHKMT